MVDADGDGNYNSLGRRRAMVITLMPIVPQIGSLSVARSCRCKHTVTGAISAKLMTVDTSYSIVGQCILLLLPLVGFEKHRPLFGCSHLAKKSYPFLYPVQYKRCCVREQGVFGIIRLYHYQQQHCSCLTSGMCFGGWLPTLTGNTQCWVHLQG